ncbi:hypothetical protein LE23_140 [Eggerthella phage LE2-3]|nr:hypothetical protein LE23_140 [Eggerthella phage LE2-3]
MEISITGMGDGDEKEVLRASAMFLVYVADGGRQVPCGRRRRARRPDYLIEKGDGE